MNDLDNILIDKKGYSFLDLIGQPTEWTPRRHPRTVTTSGGVNALDFLVRVDATAGAVTMTLETAVGCDGRIHRFKKIDASGNAMTIEGAGSELIDGALNQPTITQYDVITVASNGVGWDML